MLSGPTLVAPLVVAGEAGHYLLETVVVEVRDVNQEVARRLTAECGGVPTMVMDDYLVRTDFVAEAGGAAHSQKVALNATE